MLLIPLTVLIAASSTQLDGGVTAADSKDGGAKASGGLSKKVISQVIHSHQSEIKKCFQAELERAPDLSGRVVVSFVIQSDGRVANARVTESSIKRDELHQCMVGRAAQWQFPEPIGGGHVDVNYPWLFKLEPPD